MIFGDELAFHRRALCVSGSAHVSLFDLHSADAGGHACVFYLLCQSSRFQQTDRFASKVGNVKSKNPASNMTKTH